MSWTFTLTTPEAAHVPVPAPANWHTLHLVLERLPEGGFLGATAALVCTAELRTALLDARRFTEGVQLRAHHADGYLLELALDLRQALDKEGIALQLPGYTHPAALALQQRLAVWHDVFSGEDWQGEPLVPAPTLHVSLPPKGVPGTDAPATTTARSIRLLEALRQLVAQVRLGVAVQSDYLSAGGPGYGLALANGYAIRGLPDVPLPLSLGTVLSEAHRVLGLGWGLEQDGTVLRVEPWVHFFSPTGAGTLAAYDPVQTDAQSYRLAAYAPGCVRVGYRRFGAALPGADTSFHRPFDVRVPGGSGAVLDLTSQWVACDWALEAQRRRTHPHADDDAVFWLALAGTYAPQLAQGLPQGTGVPDPATTANWSLSPLHQLQRHLPRLGAAGPPHAALRLSAGAGNARAAGGPGAAQALAIHGSTYAEPTGAYSFSHPLPDPETWTDAAGNRLPTSPVAAQATEVTYPLPPATVRTLLADPTDWLRLQTGPVQYLNGYLERAELPVEGGLARLRLLTARR